MSANNHPRMQVRQGISGGFRDRCRSAVSALCLGAGLVAAAGVAAQSVDLDPLLLQHDVTAMAEVDGHLFAGLDGGGVAVLPVDNLDGAVIWTAGADLSGNDVTDMAWTGENLWIATGGNGLTRVNDPAGSPAFRQFAINLGGLDLTAVTGGMIGGSERVYYAMDGAGIGQIVDGLSGNLYTAEQDDLISNTVNAMQIWEGQLFVGTPIGVSRFANNVFTDQNAGLGTTPVVNDFAIDSDGNLLAATNGGIYRWNDTGSTWQYVWAIGAWVTRISCRADEIWALGVDGSGNGVMEASSGGIWRDVVLPKAKCRSVLAGADVWIGGRTVQASGPRVLEQAYVGRRETADQFTVHEFGSSLVRSAEGITFGAGGEAWIGDWGGRYVSKLDDGQWSHLWESANVAPDSNGVFTGGGNVLAMATGPDGTVWANQFTVGLLRIDGATGKVNHITSATSGLTTHFIVNLVTHPDGPLIAMFDASNTVSKVDVLVDPAHWRNPANWMVLPRDGGLGTGPTVWDAVVERRDVIWFAVEDVGLVRWDINGDAAGPNDTLTWLDQSDDRWDAPITAIPGTTLDPGKAVALALGRDGTLWAGGNGVIQFTYDSVTRRATLLTSISEKVASSSEGLVNGNVADLAIDVNGDVWVATRTGLNRVNGSGNNVTVEAWIDLANYYGSTTYQTLYSEIAPLPGVTYRKIVADSTGRQLLLSSDQGTVLITVGSGGGTDGTAGLLDNAYCYPNPWLPDTAGTAGLRMAGFPGGVSADEPALVEIYDLQGELVYADDSVLPELAFWNGTNRMGNRVKAGMYVIRLSWGGQSRALTLAVVR
ncbi:MAG: hypothetical protein IPP62_12385 [bacterium]|nr:hypothetical protein [bacterium]